MPRSFPLALLLTLLCLSPLASNAAEATPESKVFSQYMEKLRQDPDSPEVNLGLARAAFAAGKYNHARLAYERLTAMFPQEARLHFELGQLLLIMGNEQEARAALELARKLDPALAAQLPAGQPDPQATPDLLQVHGRVAAGMMYDSNYNNAPLASTVMLGTLPFRLSSESQARSSLGAYGQGQLNLNWHASPESPWWLVSDAQAYYRHNSETHPRRNIFFGRAAAGLRHIQGQTLVEVKGKYETLMQNGLDELHISGAEVLGMYIPARQWQLYARAGLEYREDMVFAPRSGSFAWASFQARWFFGESGHSIMGGTRVYQHAASHPRYSYDGLEPSLSLLLNLPWQTELISTVALRLENYHGSATVFEKDKRSDKALRLSVFASKKFAENWQVEAGWQFTNNHSSSPLNKYRQHQVTLGLAFTF